MSRPGHRPWLAVLLACGLAAPGVSARADIAPAALAQVGVHARAGVQAPLGLAFTDQDGRATTLGQALAGRPAVVLFEDYRCDALCGPALAITARAVASSGLQPGRDFGLVTIPMNPRTTPADARAMRDARLAAAPELKADGEFLTGSPAAIAAAAGALGFGYAYDPASGQYTHPVAAFVLTPAGRLSRVLSEIGMTGPELRRAVGAADRGGFGAVIDQLALVCHGIVAAAGRYDGAVALALKLTATATLLAMAGGLAVLAQRRRRA